LNHGKQGSEGNEPAAKKENGHYGNCLADPYGGGDSFRRFVQHKSFLKVILNGICESHPLPALRLTISENALF